MSYMAKKIGSLLREARKAKKLSQQQVADHFKISKSAVSQWESDDTRPDSDKSRGLAKLYGLSLELLLPGDDDPDDVAFATDPMPNVVEATNEPRIPKRSEMPRDVPVYGTGLGSESGSLGDFVMNGDIADYVRRPPGIAHRRDVFGLWLVGDSMKPWRKPRELVYVEKQRQAMIDDHVVVELQPPPGESFRPTFVKKLVRMTSKAVRLEQYNPPKTFDIDRKRVLHIYRVMEWPELFEV